MQCANNKNKPSFLPLFFSILVLFTGLSPLLAAEQADNSITALKQIGKAFASIAEKASPAVVGIKANKVSTQQYYMIPDWPFGDSFGDDFFNQFFQQRRSPQQRQQPQQRKIVRPVQGSGFIISDDGYILTNHHLVGDAESVMVKIGDSSEIKAQIIGTDPDTDVAVIKVKKTGLPHLELADSDKIEVGEWVIAIGNPFGLSHTVTAGIVSAKDRSAGINKLENFIQTDAAINPGNSGGPLIDLDGKVVGINAAIIGPGGNIGIGFAIPINLAKKVYKDLISEGKVVRGYLGVSIQDLTDEMAKSLGLKEGSKGAIVPEVKKDTPAEKAGICQNDVIVEFEGKPIEGSKELQNMVTSLKPGAKVQIVVLRDGERKTLTATLEESKSEEGQAQNANESGNLSAIGIDVQNLTDQLAEQLDYEGLTGVVATNVETGSVAERNGLTAGALIMEINQKKIKNIRDFKTEVNKAKKGDTILLLVQDKNGRHFIPLQIPED
jgi:serine protease Do